METNSKLSAITEKIIKWGIYIFVFLAPLFFLPFNSSVLEINKQLLITVFALLFLVAWVGKIISAGRFDFKKSFINIAVVLFLIFYLVSSLLSKNIYQALVGFGGGVGESFFSVVALAVIFFVIANNLRNKNDISNTLFSLTLSGLVAGIFAILQLSGKFLLPWDFAKSASFNTVGSINSLEIFLSGLLVLCSVLFVQGSSSARNWRQIFYGVAAAIFLFMALSINFTNVWWALLLTTMIVISLGIINREQMSQYRLILPMVILAFSVMMLLVKPQFFTWQGVPAEISPSFSATFDINKEVMKNKLFFGSGPGSFAYDYGLYRSASLNQTQFWNIKFNSGISKVFSQPATIGVLGWLTWMLMLIAFAIYGFMKLVKRRGEMWAISLGVFSFWLLLAFLQFLYSANLTLEIIFWVTMALTVACLGLLDKKEGDEFAKSDYMSVEFERNSPLASIFSFVFVVILVLSISVIYLGGTYWWADVLYQKGLNKANANDLDGSSNYISQAVTNNPYNELYLRTLSQVALLKVSSEASKPQSNERDTNMQNMIASATNLAKRSTDLAPLSSDNWTQRAYIYQSIMPLLPDLGGADQWAIDSYNEAIKLEPQNPYFYWELGQTYALASSLISQSAGENKDKIAKAKDYLAKAEEAFKKSLEVKSDYAPASYNLALVFSAEGKSDEAIKEMLSTQALNPDDIGVTFQLGLLYYNKSDWNNASQQFVRAINIDSNYANARYFLGLTYDKQGNKTAAIEQFKKVAETNPDNQQIKDILANLQAGKSAITQAQPQPSNVPIQDKTPQEVPPQPGL